ncbi:hypothetical protein HDU98_006482 [Podochytrium sp. JEL0797]|nr:hypothetical protein HDU98_006482 [Podochytrium sp. JEL0797]
MASQLDITAKYIETLEFKAKILESKSDALEAENLTLKRRLELAENEQNLQLNEQNRQLNEQNSQLNEQNLQLKERVELQSAEIEKLKKQVPPPQQALATPTIQIQTTTRESLEPVPKNSLPFANARSKLQLPPPQPATLTPAIQTRAMPRESVDLVAKKPRLATTSPSLLLRDESDGSNFSHHPDIFDVESQPPSPEFRRRKQPTVQTRASAGSAEQQPTSEKDPVEEFKCYFPTCDDTFETEEKQIDHVKNFHSLQADIKFRGRNDEKVTVQLERHEDGMAYCPCGKSYRGWRSLQQHANQCDVVAKAGTATNRPSKSNLAVAECTSDANLPSSQFARAVTGIRRPPPNAPVRHRAILTQIMPDYPNLSASDRKSIDTAVLRFLHRESEGDVSSAQNGDIGIPVDLVGRFQNWAYQVLKKHYERHVANKPEDEWKLKPNRNTSLHIDTAKYIAAIEFKSNTLEIENRDIKKRVESLLVDNATLKTQLAQLQQTLETCTIQSQILVRESIEPGAKETRSESLLVEKAPHKKQGHRAIITQIMPEFPILPDSNRRAIDNAVIAFLGNESEGEVCRAQNGDIGIPEDLVGGFQEWIYDQLKKLFADRVMNNPE